MRKQLKKKPETMPEKIDAEILKEYGLYEMFHKLCGRIQLEDIFTADSVYLAAQECASGFRHRKDTEAFMSAAARNALILSEKILSGKFRPKYYKETEITERGKKRIIKPPTFECKVVQKVLCNYLIRELFEKRMISTNYASVRGRGTAKMYRDILKTLNKGLKGNGKAIVMTDFRGYFASIDTGILKGIYEKYVQDARIVDLIMLFSPDGTGLSLGNEVSQIPASFFPSIAIDHLIKDKLGLPLFRYMDDTLLICDKEDAEEIAALLKRKAESIGLTIPNEKVKIVPVGENFIFCKERFLISKNTRAYYSLQNPAIARNEIRKLESFAKKIGNGRMRTRDAENQYRGVRGMVRSHPNTRNAVHRMDVIYEKSIRQAGSPFGLPVLLRQKPIPMDLPQFPPASLPI